jgi:RuvB-like protein 2
MIKRIRKTINWLTKNYTEDEIRQIIETRCEEEDVEMTEDALEFLTKIGS